MGKIIYSVVFFLFFTVMQGCGDGKSQVESKHLSAEAFAEKINSIDDAQVVDVRTPEEYKKGHVSEAMNINWNGDHFETQSSALDKSKPVFVYCLSGGRSASAAEALRLRGFENVYEMPGGMMEWRSKGLPEEVMEIADDGMTLADYELLMEEGKLTLVDFYADWCAPCKKMKPFLEKISQELADEVSLVRINADENAALCKELGVSALPVLKLYRNNEVVWQHAGFVDEAGIREQIKNHASS